MSVIVHISDTHFGTEIPDVVTALHEAVSAIAPDIIILSGDITQRARTAQFKAAAEFFHALPAKTKLIVPGNHDIPLFNLFARFLYPYRGYRKAFGSRTCSWHSPELGIVCYDATHPTRHTRGKLNPRAVRKAVQRIKPHLNPDALIIACAHQPLATSWKEDTHEVLLGRDAAAQAFAESGVDMVLSGHVHVPMLMTTKTFFPSLPRHFVLAGAGTAVSHRIRSGAPNSFNVIRTGKDAFNIRYYEFNTEQKRFVPAHPVDFARSPHGWEEAPAAI